LLNNIEEVSQKNQDRKHAWDHFVPRGPVALGSNLFTYEISKLKAICALGDAFIPTDWQIHGEGSRTRENEVKL
jgi:hypothetical protein